MNKFSLSSASVVTPEGIREATVHISDGKIVDVVPGRTKENDLGDAVILPGLIDPHVHINEPGRTAWEGFETATRAAVSGGVTTLIDMPLNSTPVTITREALEMKRAATKGKLWANVGCWGGLVPENATNLTPLLDAGVLGIKAFLVHSGIDDFPASGETELRQAMPVIARSGKPLLVHAELKNASVVASPESGRLPRRFAPRNDNSYADYLASRPDAWEYAAIELVIRLAREYQCPAHIVHLSSATALPIIRKARDAGLPLTVETCPHYLLFAAEDIPDGRTEFKCAPPIRSRENGEALWAALRDGTIDFIATDHSPCPPDMKLRESGDFTKAWGGIASLGLTLPLIWTEAKQRGFTMNDVARWLATRPATFIGLSGKKGEIRAGADADLVVFDPHARNTIRSEQLFFRHKLTPYLGRKVSGRVEQTFLDGKLIFDRGTWCDKPCGRLL